MPPSLWKVVPSPSPGSILNIPGKRWLLLRKTPSNATCSPGWRRPPHRTGCTLKIGSRDRIVIRRSGHDLANHKAIEKNMPSTFELRESPGFLEVRFRLDPNMEGSRNAGSVMQTGIIQRQLIAALLDSERECLAKGWRCPVLKGGKVQDAAGIDCPSEERLDASSLAAPRRGRLCSLRNPAARHGSAVGGRSSVGPCVRSPCVAAARLSDGLFCASAEDVAAGNCAID